MLLLALLLTSCAFTTDAAATVGSERITVGEYHATVAELRAQVGERDWPTTADLARREAIDRLIESRLLRLEARRHNIAVTDAEVDAALRANLDRVASAPGQQREGQLDSLAAGTAQQLRPELNQYGGAGLPDNDLVQLVRAELGRMQGALDARSQAFPGTLSEELARSSAGSLAGALAGKGVNVPAARLEPYLDSAARQLEASRADAVDQFQQGLAQSGVTSGSDYRRNTQRQLLDQKLQRLYVRPVNAITLQQLVSDSRERAQEALEKARAGTAITELAPQYARENARSEAYINSPGSLAPELYDPQGIRQLFPNYQPGDPGSLKQGQCSDVQPLQGGGFGFLCITKVEQRDPTVEEVDGLRALWVRDLRDRYPVWENPELRIPQRPNR